MANIIACPKCSSEKTKKRFLYGSKTASAICLVLGLVVIVQDHFNWLAWALIIAGAVAYFQKKFKCTACDHQWT